MSTHASPLDVSTREGVREHERAVALRADARTRAYRLRRERGESTVDIAKADGTSAKQVSAVCRRVLPEDRAQPRPALTRGQLAVALGYPASSI